MLAGPQDRSCEVTHFGQDGEHEAFAVIPENLQRIVGNIRVVSGKKVDAAAEVFQFRGAERAGDGNGMKWKGRRHPSVPRNETFCTHPVRRGEGRVIRIAHWQAPRPVAGRWAGIFAGLVVGAMGHLFTWQSREP